MDLLPSVDRLCCSNKVRAVDKGGGTAVGELGMLCAYHRLKGGLSQVGILVRVHVMKFSAQVLIFFPCLCIPAPSDLLRTLTCSSPLPS